MSEPRIEPPEVVRAVEGYVDKALRDADKYENSEPLDAGGVWSLHALAAKVYAAGWEDGERSIAEKFRGQHQRAADHRATPVPPADDTEGRGGL